MIMNKSCKNHRKYQKILTEEALDDDMLIVIIDKRQILLIRISNSLIRFMTLRQSFSNTQILCSDSHSFHLTRN